jgi:hypothetical protein
MRAHPQWLTLRHRERRGRYRRHEDLAELLDMIDQLSDLLPPLRSQAATTLEIREETAMG